MSEAKNNAAPDKFSSMISEAYIMQIPFLFTLLAKINSILSFLPFANLPCVWSQKTNTVHRVGLGFRRLLDLMDFGSWISALAASTLCKPSHIYR